MIGDTAERIFLDDGPLDYRLRRSKRARRLRVTIDPRLGVVVTIPAARSGARQAAAMVGPFLREREPWLRRHLSRRATALAGVKGLAAGTLVAGSWMPYRGASHQVRLEPAAAGVPRSNVLVGWSAPLHSAPLHSAPGSTAHGPSGVATRELVVRLASRDRRRPERVLEEWLRSRAADEIESAIERHEAALGVRPTHVSVRDARTRWGSASRDGRLAFSWRLILAPPEALETVVVHELAHLRIFGHGPDFWAVVASRMPEHLAWRRWLRTHSIELHATLAEEPAAASA